MIDGLTPRQQAIVDELFAFGAERPTFAPDLHRRLLDDIRAGVAEVADRLLTAGSAVNGNKYALDAVHSCERRCDAESRRGFPGWTAARAKGVVAHKAITLGIFAPSARPPLALVDDAIAALEDDDDDQWTPGQWLRAAPAAEKAALRAEATTHVTMFDECFPPLEAAWIPRVDCPLTVEVVRDAVTLRARPDLMLGRARGTTARCLVVDFKTGRRAAAHYDDARFYALLVTLRTGVPPYRSAVFYLDSGTWAHVDVDEDELHAAARRVVDGVVKLGQIALGERDPVPTPGASCSFCCIRQSCDVALTSPPGPAADEEPPF